MLRHLPGARGIGFELDTAVFRLTSRNLAALGSSTEILNADYVSGLGTMSVAAGELLVAFIAPPWGDALSSASGLDLRRTAPPIVELIGVLGDRFRRNLLLCAIQVYEKLDPISLAELRRLFDWSALRIYGLNAPGENHGILLGTRGWAPGEEPPWRSSTQMAGPGH